MSVCGWCRRFDPQLEGVLRHRRRLGRYMPAMKVIPPGLDFSSLKVDLPEDPAIKEMEQMKPAFNARTTSPHSFQANDAFGDAGSKGADAFPPPHLPPASLSDESHVSMLNLPAVPNRA